MSLAEWLAQIPPYILLAAILGALLAVFMFVGMQEEAKKKKAQDKAREERERRLLELMEEQRSEREKEGESK